MRKQRVPSVLCAALAAAMCISPVNAQTNEWTWMGGSKTPQIATYGTLGVPSAGNLPGSRHAAVSWTDAQGNFWMFGGDGTSDASGKAGSFNDLWEYNPSTNEWTWMGGVNNLPIQFGTAQGTSGTLGVRSTANLPQGRFGAVGWVGKDGSLWLFGGTNGSYSNNAIYNDLWRFNPTTKEWTWMSGVNAEFCTSCSQPGVYGSQGVAAQSNTPGSRVNAISWADKSGNFWLFGGEGLDSAGVLGYLNDLWKYSPSTNQWTWVAGNTTVDCTGVCGRSGVYGTKGTASPANLPGGRYSATAWTDSAGRFWLFGGFGPDSANKYGLLNDLWEFDPATNQWTWKGGDDTVLASCITSLQSDCGAPGSYGTLQVPAASNAPGSRTLGATWADSNGNLWLFGGDGIDAANKWGYLNDLWEYSTSTNQWTWMGGSSTVACYSTYCGQPGVYGTLGQPGIVNVPSGRQDMATWVDTKGNLWLFGGVGVNVTGMWEYFMDMWRFQPNTNNLPAVATPTFSPAPGTFTSILTVTLDDTTPGSTIYYTINGDTSSALQYTAPIPVTSSETIQAIAVADGYANSLWATADYTLQVTPAPSPTFSPSSGTYTSGQTVSLSDTVPSATIYYTTDGSAPTVNSAVYTSPITVSASGVVRAIAAADHYSNSPISSAVYTIGSTAASGQWAWMGGSLAANPSGVYGTLETPAAGNSPGARDGAAHWTDSNGDFWLFGGKGYDAAGVQGYLNDLWMFNPATHLWSWISGSNTVCHVNGGVKLCTGALNVYGTLGSPAAGNTPGGRSGAATWTDNAGKLWLFGGNGEGTWGGLGGASVSGVVPGELNDLWMFDPATNLWTWVGGTNMLAQPGSYGGLSVPGPGNVPGGRYNAASWVDHNGNFWLFGGYGRDGGGRTDTPLNDLWEFNLATREWTWMAGSEVIDISGYQKGWYGTLGIPSAANIPESRSGAAAWTDKDGNLWLYGGVGGSSRGKFNDLWRYNIATGQWIWMAGASGPYCTYDPYIQLNSCSSQPSVPDAPGVAAAANTPAGGSGFSEWTDSQGNFWLMGGTSSDITSQDGGFHLGLNNALWAFNPTINQWSWMGGDNATSNCVFEILNPIPFVVCPGSQGSSAGQGVFAAGNIPSARSGAATWTDRNGNLWLFSGTETNLTPAPIQTADLWEYQPSTLTLPPAATPVFNLVPGVYTSTGQLTMSNGMSNATIYYTTDGTMPTVSSAQYTSPITLASSQTVQAIAAAPGYRNSATQTAAYILPTSLPAPAFSVPSGTYTTIQNVTISGAAPGAIIYYTGDGSLAGPGGFPYTGPVAISSSLTLHAANVALGYFFTHGIAAKWGPFVVGPNASATYTINLPPATAPTFNLASGNYTTPQTLIITDTTPGAAIYFTADGTAPTQMSNLYSGPISISTSATIQAIAVATGYKDSSASSISFVFPPAATPAFSVPPGTYTSTQTVAISDATPSATIYYTIDGTKPTTGSTIYTKPFTVSSSQTIQAIATANGYSTSAIASVQYTVNPSPADFSVTASSSSLVIKSGQSGSFSLTLTPLNGFNTVVSFSCSGLPAGASCSFSPATVTPNGGSVVTQVTVSTSLLGAMIRLGGSSLAPIFLTMMFGWLWRKKSTPRFKLLLLMCAVSLFALNGCGGASAPSGGQPATSAVTITATAGAMQRTTTFTLTIQ